MKPKFSIVAIALLLAVLLFGCSTPRKLAGSTKETAKTEEKRDETTAAEFRRTVDSTKTEGVEVTYTKIEFFPPEPDTRQTKPDAMQAGRLIRLQTRPRTGRRNRKKSSRPIPEGRELLRVSKPSR